MLKEPNKKEKKEANTIKRKSIGKELQTISKFINLINQQILGMIALIYYQSKHRREREPVISLMIVSRLRTSCFLIRKTKLTKITQATWRDIRCLSASQLKRMHSNSRRTPTTSSGNFPKITLPQRPSSHHRIHQAVQPQMRWTQCVTRKNRVLNRLSVSQASEYTKRKRGLQII